jgi:transposase-like protein
MSTREIVGHLRDLYGIEVSPDLISAVTDAVLEEVAAWQARPLEATYPLVFFDALRVKIRDEGLVRNKAVHIALGVSLPCRLPPDARFGSSSRRSTRPARSRSAARSTSC